MKPNTSAYSGTPLARKLGYKAGMRVYLHQTPDDYQDLLAQDNMLPILGQLTRLTRFAHSIDLIHGFFTRADELAVFLPRTLKYLNRSGTIWVSWPKRSAKKNTDLNEDRLRDIALPLGLVDVKVCAVDVTWSGLKFVIRKELR